MCRAPWPERMFLAPNANGFQTIISQIEPMEALVEIRKVVSGFGALLVVCGCVGDPSEVDLNSGPYDEDEVLGEGDLIEEGVGAVEFKLENPESLYPKALVRLDFSDGRCSGFLIAPNMIAASSRCLVPRREPGVGGSRGGLDWGYIELRIVYKPSDDESMCLNEPCRNANGTRRNTTVAVWSDQDYDGDADDGLAILTRIQGFDFPTRPASWNGATPRGLSDTNGDFLRVLKIDASSNPLMNQYGYGFYGDGAGDLDYTPRRGRNFRAEWIWSEYGRSEGTSSPICAADEGGPSVLEVGPQNSSLGISRNIGVGSYSHRTGVGSGGRCGGTRNYWTRLDAKEWMMEEIMDWADRPGTTNCRHFSLEYDVSGLSRVARYFRCW